MQGRILLLSLSLRAPQQVPLPHAKRAPRSASYRQERRCHKVTVSAELPLSLPLQSRDTAKERTACSREKSGRGCRPWLWHLSKGSLGWLRRGAGLGSASNGQMPPPLLPGCPARFLDVLIGQQEQAQFGRWRDGAEQWRMLSFIQSPPPPPPQHLLLSYLGLAALCRQKRFMLTVLLLPYHRRRGSG